MASPLVAIVDDDEALCSAMVDLMRSLGYRAEAFGTAEAFLTSPDTLHFDCIIADVHMPGMGGFQLVRKLLQESSTTPVILITASPNSRLDEEAISAGAKCLLRIPLETEALIENVEKCLSRERPKQ